MIKKIMANNYTTNSYFILKGQESVLIDPVGDIAYFRDLLQENNAELKGIIYTHGHYDHIASANELYKEFGCSIYIHEDDMQMLLKPELNLSGFFGSSFVFEGTEKLVSIKNGESLTVGQLSFKIIHTPGHTPGCICIIYDNAIFTGDTLFKGSIGRTDFPGGSFDVIKKSLEKLKTMNPDFIFHPGHGESGTIGDEVAANPYFR